MSTQPQLHYRRTLAFLPQFGDMYFGSISPIKRTCERFRPYWEWKNGGDEDPVEYLWERATVFVEDLYGGIADIPTVRSILRSAAAFREQVNEFLDPAKQNDRDLMPHQVKTAIGDGEYQLMLSPPARCPDAHLEFVRKLWSTVTTEDLRGTWDFGVPVVDRRNFLSRHYAIAALYYAELTKLSLNSGSTQAVNFALRGERALRIAIDYSGKQVAEFRRELGRKAAAQRYRTDEKQAAKALVYNRWRNWKANREKHPSSAQFAHSMVNQFPNLKSTQTVERWVREWGKGEKMPLKD